MVFWLLTCYNTSINNETGVLTMSPDVKMLLYSLKVLMEKGMYEEAKELINQIITEMEKES